VCVIAAANKIASAFWRRLDSSGADAADLWRRSDSWAIEGAAVFLQDGRIARLHYEVRCDEGWNTRAGIVRGSLGERSVELEVTVDAQRRWRVNGAPVDAVEGCIDLDLNFTPATNLIQFRRLGLPIGAAVEAPAAWLAMPQLELRLLPQTLKRTSADCYDYAAPTEGYAGVLEVDESGFVREYPELWTAEAVHAFREVR
jgi:hypothetical protein